jgi:hypothetical protein
MANDLSIVNLLSGSASSELATEAYQLAQFST